MDIAQALQTLAPGAEWVLNGDDYSGLTWLSEDIKQPTKKAVEAEVKRLQKEYADTEYQRLRKAEYPPVEDIPIEPEPPQLTKEELKAIQEAEAKRAADLESALAKLAKLGLTKDEAKAVIGID